MIVDIRMISNSSVLIYGGDRMSNYKVNSSIEQIYELTPLQTGILYQCLSDKTSSKYITQFTIDGIQNELYMNQAINMIEDKYSVLRTAIIYKKISKPRQILLKHRNIEVMKIDLSMYDDQQVQVELQKKFDEDVERGFDLQNDSLIRIKYFVLHEKRTIMLWSIHHILLDGWSSSIILQDFITYYNLLKENHSYDIQKDREGIPEYREYVKWLEEQQSEDKLLFWKNYLKDYDSTSEIVPTRESKKEKEKIDTVSLDLSVGVYEELTHFAKVNGITLNNIFEAAWSIVLQRYSNSKDIVFGKVISGREAPLNGIEKIAGLLMNTIPFRVITDKSTTIMDMLNDVRNQGTSMQRYGVCSLVDIQGMSVQKRDLFHTIFSFENYDENSMANDKNKIRIIREETSYPITLDICVTGQLINIRILYSTKLYERQEIDILATHIQKVLNLIVNGENQLVNDIDIVEENERHTILNCFNQPFSKEIGHKNVIQLFEEQAAKRPEDIAIISGKRSMTYAEFNQKANQLARKLRQTGIKPNDYVVLYLDRSIEMMIGIYGVVKAGAAYVPINSDYPMDRVDYIIKDSNPKAVLVYQTNIDCDVPVISLDDRNLYTGDTSNLVHVNSMDDVIYCIYTSGTTGKPKGVMNLHKGLLNRIDWMMRHYGIDSRDALLQKTIFTFDVSVWEIFMWGLTGGKLALLPYKGEMNPVMICNEIEQNKISRIHFVPSMLNAFLVYLKNNLKQVQKLASLKTVFCSGEALNPESVNEFYDLFRQTGIHAELANLYGPTEASIDVTYYDCKAGQSMIPIGKPIPNIQIYILKHDRLCGIGMPGELCIAGIGVAKGYINKKQLTEEKFIRNPFGDGFLYKTGDLARWLPDGNIEYLGRIDEQVKIRGFRIELGEITSLLKKISYVKDCAVVVKQDHNGDKFICAYIVSDIQIDVDDIKSELGRSMPEYMVPAYIQQIDFIPVTSNGKLNRHELPEINVCSNCQYEAPRNENEKSLCEIFEAILNREKIGIRDNFFKLGGHSLKAIQLINRIEAKLGVSIEVQEVFQYPTAAHLSHRILIKNQTSYEPIPRAEEREYYLMSSSQKRIYLVCQLDKNSVAYNLPQLYILKGKVDAERIRTTIQTLMDRHEILRTEFTEKDGDLVQRVRTDVNADFIYEDEALTIQNELIKDFTKPFDLGCAPLLRCKLVKQKDKYLLLIDTHHIISDGMSSVLFMQEFCALYNDQQLEEVHCQYKDYSEWMNSRDLSSQKEYWLQQFSGEIPILDIPYDFKRPLSKSFRGNIVQFEINPILSDKILQITKDTGTTEYMVFLTFAMILLSKYSRQQEIIIGSPISSRKHKDTEKILGMFVNTLAMKGQPAPNKSFETFLNEMKENCIKAYENQEYPFEELIENIELVRDMSRNPMFDVMLAFQNDDKIQVNLEGIQTECVGLSDDTSKFDLTFNIDKIKNQYQVEIRYCTDLFQQETIETLGQYFIEIMQQVTEDREKTLKELQLINAPDRKRILYDFNQTNVDYPKDKTMKELFESQVIQTPNNAAVIYENQSITYLELNQKANQLAYKLRNLGIKRNDYVIILVERSIEMLIAVYGVIKAGGAYVPISTGFPKERIEYIINDCKPKAIIRKESVIDTNLPVVDLNDCDVFMGNCNNLSNVNTANDFMYCTYTSGTTGTPKGIPVRYRSLINLANWYKHEFSITENTKNVIIAPLSFDLSMRNIFGLHMSGGTVCLCGNENIFDADKVDEFIQKNDISLINCAASAYYALLFADREREYSRLKTLKNIYLVGEILSFEKIKDFILSENCNANIVNGYGPTEDSGISTTYWVTPKDGEHPSIPVGKPLYNKRIYILDGDNLCGIGVKGEICICGAGVTDGYLNLPQLTEKKFVKDPFGDGMMFRTGDLGRWLADGNIEFLGRLDELVKIRGYRVELGDIENTIKKIKYVKDCAVIVRKNNDLENEIYAYIVSGQKVNISEIRNILSTKIPEYMIPAYIAQINKIPVTSNGKLDRRLLPDIDASTGKEYAAPKGKTEKLLCEIYQRVLKIERVGVNDNFFELGGHSLKALKVINEIENEFGVRVEVKELFSSPTVKGLSEKIQKLGVTEYSQLPKAVKKDYYPMSSTQKRVYIVNQINGAALAYNMPHVIKLKDEVDYHKVKDAFQTMINQHEILRTEFLSYNGELVQRIKDDVPVDFTYIDSDVDEETYIQDFLQPFQLDHAPLFRVQLVKRNGYYLLLFDIHHIITDGVSMGNMFQQFSKLYNGEPISRLYYQYKDYSEWMIERDLSKQKEYWENQFKNHITVLDLPLDYARPKEKSFQGAATELTIGEELYHAIDTLCKNTGTTQYMVFLSAVMILLSKFSGQDDIVVGNGISGRVHKDTEDMLGMFVNTLAMRGNPAKEKTYLRFLDEVKDLCLDAYSNQEYPFEELVNDINVERDLSRNPLFDVMLVLQNMEEQSIDLRNVESEYCDYHKAAAKFDLTFKIFKEKKLYHVVLEYSTDLFAKETAKRLNAELVGMLKRITRSSHQTIHDIQTEIQEEQKLIIEQLNHTDVYYPQDKTIVDLFEEQAARTPNNIAVQYDCLTITYEELNQKANQLARKLRAIGVKPNDFVVIIAKRSIEMLIAVYGILKAGGAYVPISPSYPKERINFMMEDCLPKAVLCYQVKMESKLPIIDLADEMTWVGDCSNLEKVNVPEDRLYCTYTSGTTGTPKGIPVRHRSEVNLITWYKEEFEITQETRNTIIAPLSFDLAQRNIFGVHTSGGMLCLYGDEEAYDAIQYAEFIKQYHITMLNCAASAFYTLLFADQKNSYQNLHSLKKIYLVGEALSYEKLSDFMESPYCHAAILNGYGATEDSGVASAYTVTKADGSRPSIPIGKPLNNKQIYVMDGDRLCGIGMRGEICICGVGVTEGYLNHPELTEKKFVKNPFGPGMMYRTGDLGRWLSDGNLEFLGRMDEQVKVRGYRIELGEIENSLKKIEYVKDTAVIAKEDANHETAVYAYLVSDLEINVAEIQERLLKTLPEYMVPAYIGQIERIPVTSNGKLDKRALPDLQIRGGKEYAPPENAVEENLCEIYKEVLKVESVGVNDGFFELGGHSLRALMVINRIEEVLGVHIGVKEIFSSSTVKGLARVIQSKTYEVYEPIPAAEEKEFYPMSSTQKRTYIVCQIDEGGTAYHMPHIMRLTGEVNADRIEQAVQTIVNRHEILRTEFITRNGELLQRIGKDVQADYQYIKDNASQEEELIQQFIRPFNFEKAPLFRACLVKRENGYLLMFDTHHIVSDGMSMGTFSREFAALYNNEQLQPLSRQYKDYSEWMRTRDLSAQKEYWLHEFSEEIPVLDLPLDYVRPKEQSFHGAFTENKVETELRNGIRDFAHQNGVTEYMVFLSAAMIVLSKYSKQEDIVIGSPISARTHKDTESMLGMFVNTLAMRGRPEGKKSFEEFLNEIKETCLKAYENQEYPFEELVEEIKIPRNMSRNPLFDVMLVQQNNEKFNLHLNEAEIEALQNPKEEVKFDLTFKIFEEIESYIIVLEYCTDLFQKTTAEWINQHLITVLQQVVRNKKLRLDEIETIEETERKQIIGEFNQTYVDYGSDKTVMDLFEEQVKKTPDKIAVIEGNKTLTYRELNEKSNQLARRLREMGVQAEDFVAILVKRSIQVVQAIYGTLKAGGAYVPIDPEYPQERIQYMLKDCKPKVVLTYECEMVQELPCLDLSDQAIFKGDAHDLIRVNGPDNLAYCIYTSGTTGQPKGVLNVHRGLFNRIMWMQDQYPLSLKDVILHKTTYTFDVSVWEFIWWGITGATVSLLPYKGEMEPSVICDTISKTSVTTMHFVPSMLSVFITYLESNPDEIEKLNSLRYIFVSGEKLNLNLVKSVDILIKQKHPQIRLINLYGPTEASIDVTYYECQGKDKMIPIGKPISNIQLYVLSNNNKLCGIGIPGELCIAGTGLSRGYLNQPTLTSEKYIQNLFGEGKLYKTGDLVKWMPDGNIDYLGRIDTQVKVRGFRIELGEIESRLRDIESISDCAVITRADEAGINDIYAYFVSDEEMKMNDIRNRLRSTLPEYMIPNHIMQISEIPLTSNGKLNQRGLPEIKGVNEQVYESPMNEKESLLCNLFQEVLGVESVGRNDNFYELGGDSIKAIRIVSKVRDHGYELTVRDILIHYTIQAISLHMARLEDKKYIQCEVNGDIVNTPMIDDFINRGNPEMHYYNQTKMIKIGDYDEIQIRTAIDAVIFHHDILRSVFKENHLVTLSYAESKRYDYYPMEINSEDYRAIIEAECSKIQKSINLSDGPLVKIARFAINGEIYLFICIHHLIMDGVSWAILVEDIYDALEQVSKQTEIVLPRKMTSYQEWAKRLNEYKYGKEIQDQIPYWQAIIDLQNESLIKAEKNEVDDFCDISIGFDQDTTETLLYKSSKAYQTEINDILLTALGRTIFDWRRQEKVMVMLEVHGREEVNGIMDIDRTLGWFTITYPVVIERKDAIDDNIIQTKEMLRRVPNKGIGYGLIDHCRIRDCILFKFMGEMDAERNKLLDIDIPIGTCSSPLNKPVYILEINGIIKNKELSFTISYNKGRFREESMHLFSQLYKENLIDILKFCMEQENNIFTESDWSTDDLESDDYMKILGFLN